MSLSIVQSLDTDHSRTCSTKVSGQQPDMDFFSAAYLGDRILLFFTNLSQSLSFCKEMTAFHIDCKRDSMLYIHPSLFHMLSFQWNACNEGHVLTENTSVVLVPIYIRFLFLKRNSFLKKVHDRSQQFVNIHHVHIQLIFRPTFRGSKRSGRFNGKCYPFNVSISFFFAFIDLLFKNVYDLLTWPQKLIKGEHIYPRLPTPWSSGHWPHNYMDWVCQIYERRSWDGASMPQRIMHCVATIEQDKSPWQLVVL